MLHTISISNFSIINLAMIANNDHVVFWQNGALNALHDNPLLITLLRKTTHCYVLENDVKARGLTSLIDTRIKIINMQQLINLTATIHPQLAWSN